MGRQSRLGYISGQTIWSFEMWLNGQNLGFPTT
jgi:hypothetical protein